MMKMVFIFFTFLYKALKIKKLNSICINKSEDENKS